MTFFVLFLYKICEFQLFGTCQSLELIIGEVGIKTGGLENFSKINNRGKTIIRYPRVNKIPIYHL